MTDESSSDSRSSDSSDGSTQAENQETTFTQKQVNDFLATERKKTEAKVKADTEAQFPDYAELKAKAGQLDELSNASKTEQERLNERIAALETSNAEAAAQALRYRIASKHKITDADAELFLTGIDEATLTAQAERLAQREADAKKNGNHVPGEGNPPPTVTGNKDLRETAQALFGGGG